MIVLSLVPCDDVPAFARMMTDDRPTISVCNDTNDVHGHVEMCSPLCAVCACCATIVMNTNFIAYKFDMPIAYLDEVSIEQTQPLLYRANSFWQPPKL